MWTLVGWRVERMCWFIALPGLTGDQHIHCTCVCSCCHGHGDRVTVMDLIMVNGHGWLWPRGVMTMTMNMICGSLFSVFGSLGIFEGLKRLRMGKSKMNLLQGRHHCHSLSDAFRGAWCQEGWLLGYFKDSTYLWSSPKSLSPIRLSL